MRWKDQLEQKLDEDFSLVALKGLIIGLGLLLIFLGIVVSNKWILAGIGAWVLIP